MSRARFEKLVTEELRKLGDQALALGPQNESLLLLMRISGLSLGLKTALDLYRQAHRDDEDGL